jgi:hypothetical protein
VSEVEWGVQTADDPEPVHYVLRAIGQAGSEEYHRRMAQRTGGRLFWRPVPPAPAWRPAEGGASPGPDAGPDVAEAYARLRRYLAWARGRPGSRPRRVAVPIDALQTLLDMPLLRDLLAPPADTPADTPEENMP